jgi:hypothetical protein
MPGLLLRGCQPNRSNARQLAVTVRYEQPVCPRLMARRISLPSMSCVFTATLPRTSGTELRVLAWFLGVRSIRPRSSHVWAGAPGWAGV